jgi:hypothetical protein
MEIVRGEKGGGILCIVSTAVQTSDLLNQTSGGNIKEHPGIADGTFPSLIRRSFALI